MADSAYNNPLPPPSRPKVVPETPLRNADFRALLETPRAERNVERTPKSANDAEKREKKAKKPHRPKPETVKEEDANGAAYRSQLPFLKPVIDVSPLVDCGQARGTRIKMQKLDPFSSSPVILFGATQRNLRLQLHVSVCGWHAAQ